MFFKPGHIEQQLFSLYSCIEKNEVFGNKKERRRG